MIFNTNDVFFIGRSLGPYKMPTAHFHEYHELYFLISGTARYFINGKIFTLSAGDIVFVPKGVFHQTDYQDDKKIERAVIVFNEDFLGEASIPYIQKLSEFKHSRIPKANIHSFHSIIRKLELEASSHDSDFENMERLYMYQLLILILRYREKPRQINLNQIQRLVQNAAKYINENYSQELTLEIMAKKYSINAEHFSRTFKKTTGVGFCEYLNIARITAAQDLLATTTMQISDIATKCGYSDSAYFIQVFKKIHGMTPKKYSMQFRK